jgi:transposase-like protein
MMPKKRRVFDKAFKLRAVKMSDEVGSVAVVAAELDILPRVLSRWRREMAKEESKRFPGHGNKAMTPMEAEKAMLKKRLAAAKMEFEILEKYRSHLPKERREPHLFVKNHSHQYPVEMICRAIQISKSGYYAFLKRQESKRSVDNEKRIAQIREVSE